MIPMLFYHIIASRIYGKHLSGSQKAEFRGRKPELRCQMTDVRGQMPRIRCWISDAGHHIDDLTPDI